MTPKSAAAAYVKYSAARVNEPMDDNEQRHFEAGHATGIAQAGELASALEETMGRLYSAHEGDPYIAEQPSAKAVEALARFKALAGDV